MRFQYLAIVVLLSGPLFSLNINSDKVLSVYVSDKGLTRISVENQNIVDVFVHPTNIGQSLNLHKSGHVFVVPNGIKEDVFLSLITDHGTTQDLKLIIKKSQKPNPIILKIKQEKKEEKPESEQVQISNILRDFVESRVPSGFRFARSRNKKRTCEGITFIPFRSYQNEIFRVDVYFAQSIENDDERLNHHVLSRSDDLACAFGSASFEGKKGTFLYCVSKKG